MIKTPLHNSNSEALIIVESRPITDFYDPPGFALPGDPIRGGVGFAPVVFSEAQREVGVDRDELFMALFLRKQLNHFRRSRVDRACGAHRLIRRNGGSVLTAVSCALHGETGVAQLRIKDGVGNVQTDFSFLLPVCRTDT